MKITKSQLRQVIEEELEESLASWWAREKRAAEREKERARSTPEETDPEFAEWTQANLDRGWEETEEKPDVSETRAQRAKDKKIQLQNKTMTRSQKAVKLAKSATVARTTGTKGLSDAERRLIEDISDIIEKIAAAPNVDLSKYRAQLNTVLNRLKDITNAEFGV